MYVFILFDKRQVRAGLYICLNVIMYKDRLERFVYIEMFFYII